MSLLNELTGSPHHESDPRWRAHIALGFHRRRSRTVLSQREHFGPLRVQKPFYPEVDTCHVYLLHPPGGMAAQDEMSIAVSVAGEASALITTPAANKVYRSQGLCSEVLQNLTVEAGGSLEWLPQGNILFGGSSFAQHTTIQAAADSRFCFWDMLCLGRPASGDDYAAGDFMQSIEVTLDGVPFYIDRFRGAAKDAMLSSPWGLDGHKVSAQMLAYPADADVLRSAQAVLRKHEACSPGLAGVSLVDGLLVVRAMGDEMSSVQTFLAIIWAELRPLVIRREACTPRIWAT